MWHNAHDTTLNPHLPLKHFQSYRVWNKCRSRGVCSSINKISVLERVPFLPHSVLDAFLVSWSITFNLPTFGHFDETMYAHLTSEFE